MDKRISPEFSRLVSHITKMKDPATEEDKALKQYIKLILVIARKYVRANVEYEDLIMAGVIGLIEAVRHFDPQRSTNFSAYAITRIKGRMYEYCIGNTTSITVPTHVGKARAYVERMTKLLDQEPVVFANGYNPRELIEIWQHEFEGNLTKYTYDMLRKIKTMVNKIALNSKTSYTRLVSLAYRSMVTEMVEEEAENFSYTGFGADIETSVSANQVADRLRNGIGDKKTAILILHNQDFNNEDIADLIHKQGLTSRRISRQAVRGLLKSAEKTAGKHVKSS